MTTFGGLIERFQFFIILIWEMTTYEIFHWLSFQKLTESWIFKIQTVNCILFWFNMYLLRTWIQLKLLFVCCCCCFIFSWFIISFNMLSIFVVANRNIFCLQQLISIHMNWSCLGRLLWNIETKLKIENCSASCKGVCAICNKCTVIGTFARAAVNDYYWGRVL